jgi:hypothetical protein
VLPEAEEAGPGLGEIFSLFPLAQVNNRINPRAKMPGSEGLHFVEPSKVDSGPIRAPVAELTIAPTKTDRSTVDHTNRRNAT